MRMCNTVGIALAATMGFLLSARVQGAVVFDPGEGRKAIGITDWEFNGIFYDVTFREGVTAEEVYGPAPGEDYLIRDGNSALEALEAVNAAVNAEAQIPTWVGESGGTTDSSTEFFVVGFRRYDPPGDVARLDSVWGDNPASDVWESLVPPENPVYGLDVNTIAVFTVVPEPGSATLLALGLVGLGVGRRRRKAVA